jgi:hypothetical protein
MEELEPGPHRLHIVHAGSHADYAESVAVIARQERRQRGGPKIHVCVRHAESPEELAHELTQPAGAIMFTGHGSPDGNWLGGADAGVDPGAIESIAKRPITTNGLIVDACYAWQYRAVIGPQSRHQMAYLAPEGPAPYSHTWLVTAVLLALLAPGSTSLGAAVTVQDGMKRGIEAAKAGWRGGDHDRWHFCILPGRPATS